MDRFGYAKTVDMTTFERNREAALAENKYIFPCKNTGRICIFTNTGQLHTIKTADIPYGKFRDKGVPIDNLGNYDSTKERLCLIAGQKELNLYRVIFVTRQSMMKVVDGGEFDVNKRTVAATKLGQEDEIVDVTLYHGQTNIILQSEAGVFLRFPTEEIPQKKKGAIGVRGMGLSPGDFVEAVYYSGENEDKYITYKEKKVELSKLKLGKRDSKGTKIRI